MKKTAWRPVLVAGICMIACGSASADDLQSALRPTSRNWPRVWTTYSTVKTIDEDFVDLKAHGVDAVMLRAQTVEQARVYLEAARRHDIRLGVRLGRHLLPNAEIVEDAGLQPEYAVMIGGVYRGKAIDRFLFEFAPAKQEIVIEPPVYNQRFAYKGRVSGEPVAHYYPEIGDPLRAEVVVPLAEYDGRRHLKIVEATVERVEGDVTLPEDSVSDRMPASYETRERNLYRLRFDLTGMQDALLDRVGVAVYWQYRGSREWYILNWAPVSMVADSTKAAVRAAVRKQLGVWTEANGGVFPTEELVALRFGDEPFYLTGHLRDNTPSVNYPLWDYSERSIERFRETAGEEIAYPRTWGRPDIYGAEAYGAWLYALHRGCAEICGVARAEARKVSPAIMVFRNTTRSGVFALSNDHDGSGPALLARNLDLIHLDPYPVGGSGYKNNIPRDMSYHAGLARRYDKPLVPWMQAHSYIGLDHVWPEHIDRMAQQQWEQGVDAIMWLGYSKGATFPMVRPDSWARAARFHARLHRALPPKPKADVAVVRSYDAWALTNIEQDTVCNPDDWLLQQWLEVWSVERGRPYDVFELPPAAIKRTAVAIEAIRRTYPRIVSNVPLDGAWYVGRGIEERVLPLDSADQYRRRFAREIEEAGWLPSGRSGVTPERVSVTQWMPHVLRFEASHDHDWRAFPMQATFTHEDGESRLILDAYYDGGRAWHVRFAPTRPGTWRWSTVSDDPGLNGKTGVIQGTAPGDGQVESNPNLRGKVKIEPGRRHFVHADGTPVLLLAEEFWDFNVSAWLTVADGPRNVDAYLDDRKAKGFNVVQMRFLRPSRANEGGHSFPGNTDKPGNGHFENLNAAYFDYLDERFDACFAAGFVVAGHPEWIGADTRISLTDAQKLERYILARYGAYNLILSLSGEFDKNFHRQHRNKPWVAGRWNNGSAFDIETDPEPWRRLGSYVGAHNPYGTPISVHPGWHNPVISSSGDYLQDQPWFDHSWIQAYKDVYAVPSEVRQDYDRTPVKPIFFAEGIREGDQSEEAGLGAYASRWEAWQSYLSGAAVHTYRHFGIYMDKWHERSRTGPWPENLSAAGSTHAGLAAQALRDLPWWKLEPAREHLRVNGAVPPYPKDSTRAELDRAVTMAAAPGKAYVVYIPKHNGDSEIAIERVEPETYVATWYNPRSGATYAAMDRSLRIPAGGEGRWIVPPRPDEMDWVLWLRNSARVSDVPALRVDPGNAFLGPVSGGKRKPRVIVTTDHGTADYDDIQSLAHLFIYADVLDIRGLIESEPRRSRDQRISYVVDAYEEDYPNLVSHSRDYPTPARLRSLIVQGNVGIQPEAGYSSPSAGSRLIISEAKKATAVDPLWVLVWGAITDVAQALHDDPSIKDALRVYFIASWNRGQDIHAARYIEREHPDLWFIKDTYTHRGPYQDVGGAPVTEGPPHRSWCDIHIKGHGALGDLIVRPPGPEVFLNYDGFKAGDSASVYHLLHGNMDDPGSPSWSGEFQQPDPVGRPDYWADKKNPRSGVVPWRHDIFEHFALRINRAQRPRGGGQTRAKPPAASHIVARRRTERVKADF